MTYNILGGLEEKSLSVFQTRCLFIQKLAAALTNLDAHWKCRCCLMAATRVFVSKGLE